MVSEIAKDQLAIWPHTDRPNAPVTFFESVTVPKGGSPWKEWTLKELFQFQTGDEKLEETTVELRQLKKQDIASYKELRKEQLPAFVIGKWKARGELETLVNLLLFDIDGGDEDIYRFNLENAHKSPYIYRKEQSLGGGGRIYIWAKFPTGHRKEAYMAIATHLSRVFDIPLKGEQEEGQEHIDTSTGDLTRLWFPAFTSPDLVYHNEKSQVFEFTPSSPAVIATENPDRRIRKENGKGGKYAIEFTDDEKVDDLVRQIEETAQDITQGVEDWFTKVLLPFAHHYGEAGRGLAHRISRFHHDYNQTETDKEFDRALAKDKGAVTIGSFLDHCREQGIRYDAKRIIKARNNTKTAPPSKEKTPDQVRVTKDETDQGHLNEDAGDDLAEGGIEKTAKAEDQIKLEKFIASRFEFRFNEITGMPEYRSKKKKGHWICMDDYRLNSIVREARLVGLKVASKNRIAETIESDFARLSNPIQEYFTELDTSNQHDFIGELARTVAPMDGHEMFRKYFEKWLVAAVANVFDLSRCTNHQCFILTGKQGAYKSSWIRNLCPEQLRPYYFEGNLNPESKDDLFATTANFIYNMDDYFASVTSKKINEFKGFVTKNKVKARRPYGRYPEDLPKICSFIASSNEGQFLHDSTGNRRFLPFEVTAIDIEAAQGIDIDKVWAQAYRLYKAEFQYWLSREDQEELTAHNEQFEVQTLEYELLVSYFEVPTIEDDAEAFVTSSDILSKLLTENPTVRLSKKKLGEALSKAGFERKQKRLDGTRRWGYLVISRTEEDRADDRTLKTTEEGEDAPF